MTTVLPALSPNPGGPLMLSAAVPPEDAFDAFSQVFSDLEDEGESPPQPDGADEIMGHPMEEGDDTVDVSELDVASPEKEPVTAEEQPDFAVADEGAEPALVEARNARGQVTPPNTYQPHLTEGRIVTPADISTDRPPQHHGLVSGALTDSSRVSSMSPGAAAKEQSGTQINLLKITQPVDQRHSAPPEQRQTQSSSQQNQSVAPQQGNAAQIALSKEPQAHPWLLKSQQNGGQPGQFTDGAMRQDQLPSVVPDRPIFATGRTRGDQPIPPRQGLENHGRSGTLQPDQAIATAKSSDMPLSPSVPEFVLREEGVAQSVALDASLRPGLPATPTVATASTPMSLPPDTARQVAAQMAVAVQQGRGGQTEIALSPKELGKVRMTLSAIDTTVSLVIQVERPETADLMRRHLDSLQQEFRAMGFADIDFDFRDQHGNNWAGAEEAFVRDPSDPDSPAEADNSPATRTPAETSGLDLRL